MSMLIDLSYESFVVETEKIKIKKNKSVDGFGHFSSQFGSLPEFLFSIWFVFIIPLTFYTFISEIV